MDSAYSPIKVKVPGYYVAGPGERVDISKHVKGWTTINNLEKDWTNAQVIAPGVPRNVQNSFDPSTAWFLVPSRLPPMELTKQRLAAVRSAEGVVLPAGWPQQPAPLTVPAGTTATLLLDQSFLTNAYPTLVFSGGQHAAFSLTYAEALYTRVPLKGNRSDIAGKIIIGRQDSILSDGSAGQVFTTLSWRTWRYIQIRITTKDQPLVLADIYGRDTAFVIDKLPGTRQVLSFFHRCQQPDGSLRGLPYWTFTDWVNSPGWETGMAPVGADGSSSVLDLQLLWAYQLAADIEDRNGMREYAVLYRQYATQLKKTIRTKYWDKNRRLFADRPEKDLYSQHAGTLAILTGVTSQSEAKDLARLLLADTSLAPASIYFKYYLHQALTKAGYGNDYLQWLDKWRENIRLGLTTWAEMSDVKSSRSDCHAWGASPNIEFFRTVLGIDSDSPGFTRIKGEPHLGALQHISGQKPPPNGMVSSFFQLEKGQWNINLELPAGTKGRLLWAGREYTL